MDEMEAGKKRQSDGSLTIDMDLESMDDIIERVAELVSEHEASAWQAVLSHVVTQLGRTGVVAAELWTRVKTADSEVELHRAAGGLFVEPSFCPNQDALDGIEALQAAQPPNVPGMGLAGIHWSEGRDADDGDGTEDGSHHAGEIYYTNMKGSQGQPGHGMRKRRQSKEAQDWRWQWVRLDYMIDNPELILDDHARLCAKIFGMAHFVKIRTKTDDFAAVAILYTSKEAVESIKVLQHVGARTFGLTIPRLVSSNCVTIPFQLNVNALLREYRKAAPETAYVILWVISGGQYRIVAHLVAEDRRRKLLEMRGDGKTFCNESYGFAIDPAGNGPIPMAARTGKVQQVLNSQEQPREFKRAPLLAEFGIRDVTFVPVSLGVIEFGMPKTAKDAALEEIKRFTSENGASSFFSYVLFWSISSKDGLFHVVADYVNDERKQKLREERGDDKTFCSESYGVGIDPKGSSPIAVALQTGRQQSVVDAYTSPTFQRRALAEEFNIQHVFWVPAGIGVIEYGTPHNEETLAEQEKFIKDKVREIDSANKRASVLAEKARRLSIGGGISLIDASKFAQTSKGVLHRMCYKMAGAKGAKAPKVHFTKTTAITCVCTFLGVFLTLLALSGADQLMLNLTDGQILVILGSWGALMTLLFSAPASPLVQPRNILGGNLISATVAILFYYLSGSEYADAIPRWLALALAPATAISAMQFFGVSHPPAGAVSLIFISGPPKITGMQWYFLLCPLLLGNIIAVLMASWINNLSSKRQYPMYW